nr:MAG TPA: hypothetical protein [Caudoviricetes sp.]
MEETKKRKKCAKNERKMKVVTMSQMKRVK